MIEQIEIDGVQAVFAKRSGPVKAGLMFRVGRADETLPCAGITHLVEHLALHPFGLTDYHSNGVTSPSATQFLVTGSESETETFLNGVCAALSNLPIGRLEVEKGILRTEEAGRIRGVLAQLAVARYGARGYGLVGYPEWGLNRLLVDDVQQWARRWFTKQNAVLWIAGEHVPRGIRLDLPEGTRLPSPVAEPGLRDTPGYLSVGEGQVVVDTVVRRSTAGQVLAKILERELFRDLRQEAGYSYTTTASYSARGDGFATIRAVADALSDQQDAVLGGIVDILAKLKAGRIEAEDLNSVRAKAAAVLTDSDVDAARLPKYAADLLSGRPTRTVEELRSQLHDVTDASVHAVANEAYRSALLAVPYGRSADWAGFAEVTPRSNTTVVGTRYSSGSGSEAAIVIGADGCSLEEKAGTRAVRYRECVALLRWPDGARQLIGTDGVSVPIEPNRYHHLNDTSLAAIDVAVHPSVLIPMPPRAAEVIPSKPVPTKSSGGARSPKKRAPEVTLVVLVGLLGITALLGTAGMVDEPDSAGWLGVGIVWAATALTVVGLVRAARRRKQDRSR